MMNTSKKRKYRVWAYDSMVYGPIGSNVLISWAGDGRIQPETWIHSISENKWLQAKNCDFLEQCLASSDAADTAMIRRAKTSAMCCIELRQFSVFAGLDDLALERFASFGEFSVAMPGKLLIKKGDLSDSIYFVLSGALRVRLIIRVGQEEKTLNTITAGEFFGEQGMFLNSTRTADVVAESHSRLFRMTAGEFMAFTKKHPEIAVPILFGIAGTLSRRIGEGNQRYYREVTSQFLWR